MHNTAQGTCGTALYYYYNVNASGTWLSRKRCHPHHSVVTKLQALRDFASIYYSKVAGLDHSKDFMCLKIFTTKQHLGVSSSVFH